jgi:FkbM family methyltransferase
MKVFAFEPLRENFKALKINILLNNLEENVSLYNFGLGNHNNKQDYIFEPVNTGASHYADNKRNKGIHEMGQVKTLDSLLESFNLKPENKVMMKVDVEGMEPDVFKGAKNFIKYFNDMLIVFESKHSGYKNTKSVLDEIAVFEYYNIDHYNSAIKKET